MQNKCLHVVSFNVPFPADYGGVQDVYYKLRALHSEGVKIILHCFDYGRGPQPELEAYCERVCYYKRRTGFLSQFHYLPYIVASRRDEALITSLLQDQHPILFEGLHCTYYLNDMRLRDRIKIYRAVNIEHRYYFHLFKAEKVWRDKLYFLLETVKLYFYESGLNSAALILAVSPLEQQYFARLHPRSRVECVPNFHPGIAINIKTGKGEYLLYHGDLSTPENKKAALWLIQEVFSKIQFPCIIAGNKPGRALTQAAKQYPHLKIVSSPNTAKMAALIADAHINVLITFQATGLKLKLLNALYAGRFCVANDKMLAGTTLQELCNVSNDPSQIIETVNNLLNRSFSEEDIEDRRRLLEKHYNTGANARKIIQWVYGDN